MKELKEFSDVAYLVASEAGWLDISAFNVHKGTTVAHLQTLLGVDISNTMVFGDGYNDVELMDMGHYSFAVSNGVKAVKDKARYVIKSNEEDAVLDTILDFVSLL